MIRVYQPASAEEHVGFVQTHCDRCAKCFGQACEILEAVVVNHETDPDYPRQWIRDDEGRPTCTAFSPRDAGVPSGADKERDSVVVPIAAVEGEPAPVVLAPVDVEVVETRVVGRGVIDICQLKGKRALSVPYADVASLFGADASDMREALGVPAPAKARVHRGKAAVTITARSMRDGASVTASVRLKVRRVS